MLYLSVFGRVIIPFINLTCSVRVVCVCVCVSVYICGVVYVSGVWSVYVCGVCGVMCACVSVVCVSGE